jgi:hypothetical protein
VDLEVQVPASVFAEILLFALPVLVDRVLNLFVVRGVRSAVPT